MFLGLKPLELFYLAIAVAIVGQQLIVRRGAFDPVALAAIIFFVGLIPAGRGDDKKKGDDDDESPSRKIGSTIQSVLNPKGKGGEQ